MLLRKRPRVPSPEVAGCSKRKRVKTSHRKNPHRCLAETLGYNQDVVRIIFGFLPADALLKMMLVSKQWKALAREDSFWRNLCVRTFPDSLDCIHAVRKEVGDYFNAFKVWHKFHCSNNNGERMTTRIEKPIPFSPSSSSSPTTTTTPPKQKMRFSLDNLLTYIEVQHRGQVIWREIQQGKSLLNTRIEINNAPVISCSFGMTPKDLQIRLSFLHVDGPQRVWVSDTYLRPERAMVSFKEKPYLLIISQGSSGADRFLGELRFLITQIDGAGFELSLKNFFTSFLKPALTNQFPVPDRHLLALLRRNLHWRPESIPLHPPAKPLEIFSPSFC